MSVKPKLFSWFGSPDSYLGFSATDCLRGVAILMVLLGHRGHIPRAGAFGVVLFLFLSGFGLTRSYLAKGLQSFLRRKLTRLLVPYTIITAVWLLIDSVRGTVYPTNVVVSSLVGLDFASEIDPTMWFVSFLVLWYLAFYLTMGTSLPLAIKVATLWGFGFLLLDVQVIFNPNVGVSLYTFCFPAGVLVGALYGHLKRLHPGLVAIGALAVFGIGWLLYDHYQNIIVTLDQYRLYAYGASMMLLVASAVIARIPGISHALRFLGGMSYEAYLIEGALLVKYPFIFELTENVYLQTTIFITVVFLGAWLYQRMAEPLIVRITG